MKNQQYFSVFFLFAFCLMLSGACSSGQKNDHKIEEQASSAAYLCPMDCKGSASAQPGQCPVCNMNLVKTEVLKAEGGEAGYIEITEESVYNSETSWTNQEGKSLQLEELKGKVQLVAMIFTSCEYACPRLMADLQLIEQKIPVKLKDKVNFTLVSIDSETDKPEVLMEYAQMHELNLDRWNLLHGEDGSVLELAALLGVRYKKFDTKAFSHSNLITVLDPKGEIAYQQVGLGTDPSETIQTIFSLLNQK